MTRTVPLTDETPMPFVTPEEYTRVDEELLREGIASVRTAVLSAGALSIGVSQRDDAPCVRRARKGGFPVVRRSTGGLGLWHGPGDVVWSLVLPRSDGRVGNDFSKAYARLGVGAVQFLDQFGVRSAWRAPSGPDTEHCLLSGRGDVLSVEGKALGGAAQHLTRLALLHHGVLTYCLDFPRLSELFDLSEELAVRSLTSLEQVVPGVSPMNLARRLRSALAGDAEVERV